MIRSILVATDGSTTSKAALSAASSIASITKSRLFGLYIEDERRFFRFDYGSHGLNSPEDIVLEMSPLPSKQLMNEYCEAEDEASELRNEFRRECRGADISGKFKVQQGVASQQLLDAAKRVDLVVMGNRGLHTGVQKAKPRETTRALLYNTATPVLIMPADSYGKADIVIAYDGSAASQRALRFAAPIAEKLEMGVSVLTVADSEQDAISIQQPAIDYLESYEVGVLAIRRSGGVVAEIIRFIEEIEASMLVIGSFSSSESREKDFGNTTTTLLNHGKIATLIVA